MEQKIPKIIHFVWVGKKEKSELTNKCIESWKKYCPDYEIMEWNEDNFDTSSNHWTKLGMETKNYALVADVVRTKVLYDFGGVYLDTDVEILKPIDELLRYNAFLGYESKHWFSSAVIGAVKNHEVLKYAVKRFDLTGDIKFNTNALTVHAFSVIVKRLYGIKINGKTKVLDNNIALLASDYFFPQHYITNKTVMTNNTYIIHYYYSSWHSAKQKKGARFAKGARKVLGRRAFSLFEKLVALRYASIIRKQLNVLDKEISHE